MFEPMLRTKIWCVRSFVTYENVQYLNICYTGTRNMFCLNLWCILNNLCPNSCYTRKYYVFSQNDVTYDNFICPNLCTHANMMYFVQTNVTYENGNVRTYITHEYELYFCPILCYIQKCNMFERMLQTKIWCPVSELILHTKLCNVRTHVTHENMMSRVRTCYIQNM